MTSSEIIALIRKRLDEMDADNSHWDDPRILSFINPGLDAISSRLPALALPELWDTDTQNIIGNISLYSAPAGMVKLIDVKVNEKTAVIKTIDWEKTLSSNYLLLPTADKPCVIYPYYDNQLKVFPEPTSLILGGLVTIFLRLAERLVNTYDIPELPYFTHPWLVDYGLYLCLLEDGDQRAVQILSDFEKNFGAPAQGGPNG